MQNALQDLRLFFFYILPQHEPTSADVPDLTCTLTRTHTSVEAASNGTLELMRNTEA